MGEAKKGRDWNDLSAQEKAQGITGLMVLPMMIWCFWCGPCSGGEGDEASAGKGDEEQQLPSRIASGNGSAMVECKDRLQRLTRKRLEFGSSFTADVKALQEGPEVWRYEVRSTWAAPGLRDEPYRCIAEAHIDQPDDWRVTLLEGGPAPFKGEAPVEGPAGEEREVSRAGFEAQGLTWPLTVDEGRVGCEPLDVKVGSTQIAKAYFVAPDGTEYALNGTAQSHGRPEIDPIWSDNPDLEGAKLFITDLTDQALELCE